MKEKKLEKMYFAIEQVRCSKLSEIGTEYDRLLGYKGYILDPSQKLFTQEALEKCLLSWKDIKRVRTRITDILDSYGEVREILKQKGATHCIHCNRTIDDCVEYKSCEEQTKLRYGI